MWVVAADINPPSVRDSSDERSGVWSAVFCLAGAGPANTDGYKMSCQPIGILSSPESAIIILDKMTLAETKLIL